MQHEETSIAAIYNGEPAGTPEQEAAKRAIQREKRAKLPKFELGEDEQFYISREKVAETIQAYSQLSDDARAGCSGASEELRSLMESVITVSYENEVKKQQTEGAENAITENLIHRLTQQYLEPGYEKRHFFSRRKPNRALRQCMRAARAAANLIFAATDAKIAEQERFVYGIPEAPEEVEELYQTLIYELAWGKRKARKFEVKHGKRLMALLTDYTQNLVRILSDHFDEELKKKIAELEEQHAKEKAAEQEEQPEAIEVDAEGNPDVDGETEEIEDNAPAPEDFEIKEGELDELDELEDIEDKEQNESAAVPVVVPEQTAMVFAPMTAEPAETANESTEKANEEPENANGEDKAGEKKNE